MAEDETTPPAEGVTINVHPEPEPHQPEPPSPPAPSVSASERSDEAQAIKLLSDNMRLAVQRVDQLADLVRQVWEQSQSVLSEMEATMKLAQQMIGEQDQQIERLGQSTAAILGVGRDMATMLQRMEAAAQQQQS